MNDLISRQAAIDAIEKYFGDLPVVVHHDMLQIIKKLPAVDVQEVKRGKWVEEIGMLMCSECGDAWVTERVMSFNYCPNCGADLRERRKHDI